MDLSIVAWAAVLAAVLLGATIQGAIGFGMNLVSVPVIALVAPDTLPIAAILLGVPISVVMARYERASVDRSGVLWLFVGRVPGSAAGAAVVVAASTRDLQLFVGAVVLLMVLASITAPPIPVRRETQVGAGFVSGITGTAAGIGGPPVALLYQRHSGPVMRATLAATFFLGTILSVTTLAVSGSIPRDGVLLGAASIPFVVLGSRSGRRFHALLERRWLRPAVLAFSAVSAGVVVVDALW
ncbi:sulfite exporter TauE/SafE family protein [Actinomarinicola tropica]|uniref:Probable membrane transporter protein n=1 Tax=Actinomarinicola tropica TaxID=2789776 RepID=A0A5Q2R9Y5_9ACTN|nr:sulfite exporter TauE/SafE family protein [Actinomarinicola tropica]QGG93699.1 TSUP family transporter [Actinomarinicola tropica]